MAGFRVPASARHPSTLVAVLLPHHSSATRRISNLHLPPAGLLCFTLSYTIPRSGCRVASSSPVPPLRTPMDESLGYSRASRRLTRLPLALPGAAAAVVVASAFGPVCFLRVAVPATSLSLSRLARSRSITKAAASGGDPGQNKDAAEGSDKDDGCTDIEGRSSKSQSTPIVLNKNLVGRQTDYAKIHLVRHVFTAFLPPDKQLQLMELVYQLALPEVFSKNWLSADEKLNAGLAMTQIYIEMKLRLKRLVEECDPADSDARVPLLNAVEKMLLAVDLLTSKRNALTEEEVKELHDLILEYKDSCDEYNGAIVSSPPV